MATKQPADKSHFILPDLGEGVHEAELIKWRVKPGEQVDEHQTLAEMETDKALVEVPSPWTGVVKELRGKEGDIINVGSILVTYAVDGDASSPNVPAAPIETAANGQTEADAGTVVGSVDTSMRVSETLTRRRPEAIAAVTTGKALATPAVRRIARARGIDINRVPGTGRGGRVTASDVEAYAGGAVESTAGVMRPQVERMAEQALGAVSADGVDERIPFRGVRRKIAESLERSVKTAVHFTCSDEADVTALDRKRKEYATVLGRKLSLLPFIMTAVCRGLRRHPAVNAVVDDARAEILRKSTINLGCAVDTDHGLMVPVIQDADHLGLVELADAVKTLAVACRDRTIEREKLTGGTFTISNVGSYGGMFATPIINYPEVAIIAAGRAKERVMTRDGTFYAGVVLPLSVSCDHRVVDGAEAARFLNTVVKLLEQPDELLSIG